MLVRYSEILVEAAALNQARNRDIQNAERQGAEPTARCGFAKLPNGRRVEGLRAQQREDLLVVELDESGLVLLPLAKDKAAKLSQEAGLVAHLPGSPRFRLDLPARGSWCNRSISARHSHGTSSMGAEAGTCALPPPAKFPRSSRSA